MLAVYNFASGGKKNDQHTEGPEHLKKTSRNPEYLQKQSVVNGKRGTSVHTATIQSLTGGNKFYKILEERSHVNFSLSTSFQ